jgi:hypothetical protein
MHRSTIYLKKKIQQDATMYQSFIIPYLYAQCVPDNVHQLHVQQPSTYEKPEAASAVLGS